MSVNKRAGREEELRKKLKATADRYESVFGRTLSVNIIKMFLEEEKKREELTFLRDRMGLLSGPDVDFVAQIIKQGEVAPELPPKLDDDGDENLEDLSFDDSDEDEADEQEVSI